MAASSARNRTVEQAKEERVAMAHQR